VLKIEKGRLAEAFALLAESMDVLLPIRKDGLVNFGLYQDGADVDLDALKTVVSPKEFFLPQAENLYMGQRNGNDISIQPQKLTDAPFVVFGVKGCDVAGMAILDSVYLGDPVDRFYEARRKHGTVVALACENPAVTCFCKPFSIDAANPAADATAWLTGEWLYIEPTTEKGKELAKALAPLMEGADGAEVRAQQEEIRGKVDALPYSSLSLETFASRELLELFDSPVWDRMHDACLACGTCTFVCPTCQCYDIADFDTGNGVIRYRCWDSCMYSDFTLMAHGNSRKSQKERFRQRYMHKLVYHPRNNGGVFGCVGCGRCVNKCPVSLNIVKVIKKFGGGNDVQ